MVSKVTPITTAAAAFWVMLKQYDRILTFKNGSIIEEGPFDALIDKKGYFYSLFTISQ